MKLSPALFVLLCWPPSPICPADGEPFQAPHYTIHRVSSPITIDGQLDEPAWNAAPEINDFRFTWYESGDKEPSTARLLWDDKYLYVAHTCTDAWITARCTEHDGPIAKDDCFEVMLTPNVERPEVYFNIEWNVLGAWVDNHRPNGPNQPRAPVWDAEGVRIAGRFIGTLNNDADRDESWTVEVAIPFENFTHIARNTPPQPDEQWSLNLNRHGGDTNPQLSQWAPGDPQKRTFHSPGRFGLVTFAKP